MTSYDQINNPKTGKKIYVYGDTFNNLIKNKEYTEEYLLSLQKYKTTKVPKSPKILKKYIVETKLNTELPEDIITEILYNADIDTINSYCFSKKYHAICHNKQFWQIIFKRDHLPLFEPDYNYSPQQYVKIYKKLTTIKNEVNLIFNLLDIEKIEHLRFSPGQGFDLIPVHTEHGSFHAYYNHDFIITPYHINVINADKSITYDYNTFKNLLIEILYYYPNTQIESGGYHTPYIQLRLKDLQNKYAARGTKQIVNKRIKYYTS